MRMKMAAVALIAAALVLGSASCGDTLAPADVAGEWAAYRINGEDLPLRLPGTVVIMVYVADTIAFDTNGRFEQLVVVGEIDLGTDDTTLTEWRSVGEYAIDGRVINLDYDCEPLPVGEQLECLVLRAEKIDALHLIMSNGIEYRAVVPEP